MDSAAVFLFVGGWGKSEHASRSEVLKTGWQLYRMSTRVAQQLWTGLSRQMRFSILLLTVLYTLCNWHTPGKLGPEQGGIFACGNETRQRILYIWQSVRQKLKKKKKEYSHTRWPIKGWKKEKEQCFSTHCWRLSFQTKQHLVYGK